MVVGVVGSMSSAEKKTIRQAEWSPCSGRIRTFEDITRDNGAGVESAGINRIWRCWIDRQREHVPRQTGIHGIPRTSSIRAF
jgi:hypothetical protein